MGVEECLGFARENFNKVKKAEWVLENRAWGKGIGFGEDWIGIWVDG